MKKDYGKICPKCGKPPVSIRVRKGKLMEKCMSCGCRIR